MVPHRNEEGGGGKEQDGPKIAPEEPQPEGPREERHGGGRDIKRKERRRTTKTPATRSPARQSMTRITERHTETPLPPLKP